LRVAREKSKEEYVGPDTSSLTAFLANLLSLSEPSSADNNEQTADSSESEGDTSGCSSESKLERGSDKSEQGKYDLVASGGVEKCDKEDLPSTSGGDDLGEWQLISDQDLINSRYFESPTVQVMQEAAEQLQPQSQLTSRPLKLPEMSNGSELLSENLRSAIYAHLPTLAKGRQWVLLYRYDAQEGNLLQLKYGR
jgi:hypothetical protein